MFSKYKFLLVSSTIVFLLAACNKEQSIHSWVGAYYYEHCCNDGKTSEYWNVVLTDSANNVTTVLYWGKAGEQAALPCIASGDSNHLEIQLNTISSASVFKTIASGTALFTIDRQNDGTLITNWKAVQPQCMKTVQLTGSYFSTSQPGTSGDPCAGENAEENQEIQSEEESSSIATDTAQLRYAWNESTKQFDNEEAALLLLKAGVTAQISKTFDTEHPIKELADKDMSTAYCVSTKENVSLHIKAPMPTFIVSGKSGSDDAAHHSRVKSITIILEFEKMAHIELQDSPGIQYLKGFEELNRQIGENGYEMEIEAYPTSSEVCITDLF